MGSIVSKPKVPRPAPVEIRYVTSPAVTSTTSSSDSNAADTQAALDEKAAAEQGAAEQRAETILRRSRGRSGTIRTGFRGLLSSNELSPARKSLLGE